MNGRYIARRAPGVTGAANEQLDAVNGLRPVTDRPAGRWVSERREGGVTTKRAGMQ